MRVFGTYRTYSEHVAILAEKGVELVRCDLASRDSIASACSSLRDLCPAWDALVICAGLQYPIAPFESCNFDQWEDSIAVNFVGQIRIVHRLLPTRRSGQPGQTTVLFFAGGGPNKATVNYSAYAVSKIALIKMCELLDAELPDTRFVILNPGWVKTKGHRHMLEAPETGEDHKRTIEKFERGGWVPMDRVLDCCDWVVNAPRGLVGGRYFGVEFDAWGSEEMNKRLAEDPNRCKLRRYEA